MRWTAVLAACLCVAGAGTGAGGPSAPAGGSARPAWETQEWPRVPVLVYDPAGNRWLEDGKPSSRRPDKDTDVELPESPKPYMVDLRSCRHLAIGRNAHVKGGSHAGPMTIWGNCWVKDGGQIHFCNVKGKGHTFFRIDGSEFPKPGSKRVYHFTPSWGNSGSGTNLSNLTGLCRTQITHKFQICKYEGGSVEFIGNVGVADEVQVQYGKCIIGPDSELRYAGSATKACFEVFDGGTLELQSGAAIAPFQNENSMSIFNMSFYRGGTLQAGSPERPITKDAYVLLGYSGAPADSGKSGIYCATGSTVRVYSVDPKKARLVFTAITSRPGFCDGKGRPLADPTRKAQGDAGIVMHFGGTVEGNGLMFDYVRRDGIRVADLSQKDKWTSVFYGPNNAEPGEQLIAKMTRNPGYYYHDRKYMRYYLVQRSLGQMEKETGEKVDVIKKETNPHKTP